VRADIFSEVRKTVRAQMQKIRRALNLRKSRLERRPVKVSRDELLESLERNRYKQGMASCELGIASSTVSKKMTRFEIERPEVRRKSNRREKPSRASLRLLIEKLQSIRLFAPAGD
jgi:transcriptional regulator with GAF, ATPase, and Fis domain